MKGLNIIKKLEKISRKQKEFLFTEMNSIIKIINIEDKEKKVSFENNITT